MLTMDSLADRLKEMFAGPAAAPVVQNAYILDAVYAPMEIKTLLMRANKSTKAEATDFNHCTITFMLENGEQGTLIESRRIYRLVDTDNRPKNITAGNQQAEEMYRNRRPGQIIKVAKDVMTGEYYLAG